MCYNGIILNEGGNIMFYFPIISSNCECINSKEKIIESLKDIKKRTREI